MNKVDNEWIKIFQLKFQSFWVLEIGVWIPWRKGCDAQNLSGSYLYLLNPNFSYLFSCQNPSFLFLWFEGDCDPPVLHHKLFHILIYSLPLLQASNFLLMLLVVTLMINKALGNWHYRILVTAQNLAFSCIGICLNLWHSSEEKRYHSHVLSSDYSQKPLALCFWYQQT